MQSNEVISATISRSSRKNIAESSSHTHCEAIVLENVITFPIVMFVHGIDKFHGRFAFSYVLFARVFHKW